MIEWYSGLSNPVVQIAAQTLGVDPSRTNGIKKMEIAANESSWAWMEAMSILSVIYQFFDLNEKILAEPILKSGDCSVTLEGGHTYTILEEETCVYEFKTGPYKGQALDKQFIDEA